MEQGQGCKADDQLAGVVLEPESLELALPCKLVHCQDTREHINGKFLAVTGQPQ